MGQSRSRRFLASSTVYFLGSTLSHLIQFFLLPLYTRALDPAEYGNYDLWTNLLIFLAPVAFFQVWDAVYRLWFDGSDRDRVTTNGYLLMALGSVMYSVVLAPVLVVTGATPGWLIYLFGFSWCIVYFYGYMARAALRNGLFVGSGVVNTLINASLGAVLVLVVDLGITGVYIAVVSGNVIQALIIELRLRTYSRLRRSHVSRDVLRRLLRFSMPLFLASIAGWALAGFTRVVINVAIGNDANGFYAVADKYTYAITMIMSVFQYAWNEMLYLSHQDHDRKDLYRYGTSSVINIAFIGAAGTIILAGLTWDLLVGASFSAARSLVPLVVLAAALNAMAAFIGSLFMAEKKTGAILWTTLVASCVNMAIAFPLVWWLGLAGAPIALAIACGVMLVARVILIFRVFGVLVLRPNLLISVSVLSVVSIFYWSGPTLLTNLILLVGVGLHFLFVTRRLWSELWAEVHMRLTNRNEGAIAGNSPNVRDDRRQDRSRDEYREN